MRSKTPTNEVHPTNRRNAATICIPAVFICYTIISGSRFVHTICSLCFPQKYMLSKHFTIGTDSDLLPFTVFVHLIADYNFTIFIINIVNPIEILIHRPHYP